MFLDEEQVAEFGNINIPDKVKKDIHEVCAELPSYKKVSEVVVRDTEFEKTTANKIKRNVIHK